MSTRKRGFGSVLAKAIGRLVLGGRVMRSVAPSELSASLLGCVGLLIILLAITSVTWALNTGVHLAESGFFVAVFKAYAVLAASSLLLALGIDSLRVGWGAIRSRRQLAGSVRGSLFPRHEYLQDEACLDSVIWRLIDSDLGRRTVRLRRSLGSSRRKNQRILALTELRDLLLRDEKLFRAWTAKELPGIFRDLHHEAILNGVYNEIRRRLLQEVDGRPTELLLIVGNTIVHDPEPALRWHVTQVVLRVLTLGKVFAPLATERSLVRLDTPEARKTKLDAYLSDSKRFRRFMAQNFFEIMAELCPLRFELPNVHRSYESEKKDEEHYSKVPVRALLPWRTATATVIAKREADRRRTEEERHQKRQQREVDVLEDRDRVTAARATKPDKIHERWIENTVSHTLRLHRSELARVRKEEHVHVDPAYGYFLAAARDRVRDNLHDPDQDDLNHYLERELRNVLLDAGPDAREHFFNDRVRQALYDCEQLRQGTLPYGKKVQELGYDPQAHRDSLTLSFVEHAERWRQTLGRDEPLTDERSARQDNIPPTASISDQDEETGENPKAVQLKKAARDLRAERLLLAVDESEAENLLLNTKDAAQLLDLTPRSMEGFRYKGGGPPYTKLSPRAIRYRLSDLQTWVKNRLRSSTSDSGEPPDSSKRPPSDDTDGEN